MSEFFFLSLEDVLILHAMQIERYGGATGIRDQGLLESAINMPQASFGGEYMHKGLYEMAAAYAFHIAENQPFIDGNKRTARMLGNALLISQDLLPISYRTVSEVVYKDALIVFYEQNTLAPFKQIFIDQIIYANQTYFRVKDNTWVAQS